MPPVVSGRGRRFCAASIAVLLAAFSAAESRAATYYWDADAAGSVATGGTGNWDAASSLWRAGSSTGTLGTWPVTGIDNDAYLGGTAGTGVLTLTTGISVNDITVNPSPSATYTITGAQTLTLNGTAQSVLDVASGSTLTITSGLAGLNGFTKSSAGTLILDSAAGTATLFGGITVNGGTLQAGSTTNNGSSQVLRSNAVTLAGGTSLTTAGTTIDLRVGALSGSGSVTPASGGAINELALMDATFSGTITTSGGMNLRGSNGTTQTFAGNLTALTGTIGINGGATMKFTGTGDSTSGVLGSVALATRAGAIVLENTSGNTGLSTGRIADAAAISFLGGTLSLIGYSAGTSETAGDTALNAGAATISVTANGGTGAQLTLSNSNNGNSLRDSTAMTVNFVGLGGTLGSAGNNPRILFGTVPLTNSTNGMLANSSSATVQTTGWAVVNGTSWAGVGANGIVALADVSRNSATLSSAASQELVGLAPSSTTTTLSANLGTSATVGIGALKISPTGSGQTLAVGTNSIFSPSLMLTGTTDFSITGTTGGLQIGSGTRYVWIAEEGTALNYGAAFPSTGPINKSGAGILNLNGSASQLPAANVNILQGVLRGTTTTLGGSTSSGGANTTTNLRGGVLEISGGGTLTRALLTAGTASGGAIGWDNSGSNRGDGGFSAIGGNATVTLVTAAGGATAATPTWNDGVFLSNGYALTMGSTKSDSRIDFTNDIGLDNTVTAGGAANNYFAREIRVAAGVGGDSTRLSGVISGSANADLLKTGAGVLELTNSNTYAGNTLIQQGTLSFSNVGALTGSSGVILSNGTTLIYTGGTASLGTVPLTVTTGIGTVQNSGDSGSTLTFGGTITKANTILTFTGSGNFIISGLITGGTTLNFNSDLNVVGTTVTLTNANNDYTGPTNVSGGGTLIDGVTNAIPTGSVATLGSSGDGAVTNTLDLDGFDQALASLNSTSNAGGTNSNRVTNSALGTGTNTLTLSGVNSVSAAVSSSFAGILQDGSTARIGLQITGGMHTLSGANSFSGGTTLSGGTLVAGNNSAVGSTGAQAVTFNGGKLASDNDARSLANNIVVNVAGNQITGANSVTLTGTASGPGTLEVALTNAAKSVTVTPASANSFAPAMLRLTSGTLLLGGANKIGDSTAVNFNGGTLNTGGFSDTVGALTLTANSVLDFGTTNNVHLQFSSAAWTGGALTVNNWTGTDFATGNPDQFLVASAGPLDSSFVAQISFTGHGTGAVAFNVGGGLYEIVPVPEPTTVLGALGLLAFLAYRERRRVSRLWSLHVAPPLILLGFLLVAFVTKDTD